MDLGTASSALAFLQTQGYFIIFLLITLEGPIITYIAAFAASLGFFNIYAILAVSILGNFVGDIILFGIGRLGRRPVIEKYVSNLLKNHHRIERIKEYLKRNPGKTMTVIKLTPPLPIPGLILAGVSELSFFVFVFYSAIICISYSTFITMLGFYSGMAFTTIMKYFSYGEYIAGVLVLFIVGCWIAVRLLIQRYTKKIEKI